MFHGSSISKLQGYCNVGFNINVFVSIAKPSMYKSNQNNNLAKNTNHTSNNAFELSKTTIHMA